MAQMQRAKIGNRAKGRQSSYNKAYYEKYRREYASKLIRRRARREKGLAEAKGKPKKEHPSDLRRRAKRRK